MSRHYANARARPLAAGMLAGAAIANTAGAQGVLEEITVTARRVEESLQQTPVAVSAFTRSDLTARGVSTLDDVSKYTPNLEFFASGISGKNSGQVYIRGVGQFDYLLTTDPGVGIYLDGVYLARSLGNILDLVDIERVEIMRGPQGTLYGKNTVGGAINVITRRPGDELEAELTVKTGSYDRINGRASVSGPLVPGVLGGKLAVNTMNADGFGVRPLAGDTAGNEESNGVQAMLEWDPTEAVNVVVSADYTRTNETFSQHAIEDVNTAAPLVGLHNALASEPLASLHGLPLQPYDGRWLTTDPFVDLSTDSNFNDQEVWGVSATVSWDIAGMTLKSITGYRDMSLSFGTDPDGSPVTVIDEIDDNFQDQLTQELQLSGRSFGERLRWVIGLYYLAEDSRAEMTIRTHEAIFQAFEALPGPIFPLAAGVACPAPPPAPCAGGAGNPVNLGLDIGRFTTLDQQTDSYAAYAQGSYDLSEQLSFTYGIRYTEEEKEFTYAFTQLQSGFPLIPPTTVDDSWDDVSHRIGLDFQWTDDLMTYFSASRGFKSGGFNGRGRSTNEITSYDPETMWSYEIGVKSEWFQRRLRFNAAAFYNDYSDLQFTLSTSDAAGTQIIVVGNAAAAEVKGFEVELLAVPLDALRLNLSAGHLDAEYTEVDPGADITEDDELIATPDWTLAMGAEYTLPLGGWGSVALRADYSYRAQVFFEHVLRRREHRLHGPGGLRAGESARHLRQRRRSLVGGARPDERDRRDLQGDGHRCARQPRFLERHLRPAARVVSAGHLSFLARENSGRGSRKGACAGY